MVLSTDREPRAPKASHLPVDLAPRKRSEGVWLKEDERRQVGLIGALGGFLARNDGPSDVERDDYLRWPADLPSPISGSACA